MMLSHKSMLDLWIYLEPMCGEANSTDSALDHYNISGLGQWTVKKKKRYQNWWKDKKEVETPSPHVFGPLIGELRVHGSLGFERACGYRAAYRHLEIAQGCPVPLWPPSRQNSARSGSWCCGTEPCSDPCLDYPHDSREGKSTFKSKGRNCGQFFFSCTYYYYSLVQYILILALEKI